MLGVVALVLCSSVMAQEPATTRPATKEQLLDRLQTRSSQLELEHAQSEMDKSQAEYDEVKRLFDGRIVTIEELKKAQQTLDRAKLDYQQAQIKLQKTRLELLKDATLVTVVDANKYRADSGRYVVSITVQNDSNLDKARTAMEHEKIDTEQKMAALLDIENVIVTVSGKVAGGDDTDKTSTGTTEAIVGDPYQQIIPLLRLGQKHRLEFELLKKDVEAVTVRVEYLGFKREYPVFLRKEATQDLPTATSTQYAQQGQLGSKIRYDIELEALGKDDKSYSLVVLNLPTQIPFAFLDPRTDARITQVKFTDQVSKQSLDLELSLPTKLEQNLVDASIAFDVFVTDPKELKNINDLRRQFVDQVIPAEALAKIKGSRVELILIPKGVGKLDILVTNLFKEVQQNEPIDLKFSVMNSGTLALRKVTPELDVPLDWEGDLEPKSADVIEPGEKAAFTMSLRPPADVVIGEYTVKIAAEGHSGVESVEGVDKNFTVRIVAKRNITGTLTLVFVLIIVVVVLAAATIRIARR